MKSFQILFGVFLTVFLLQGTAVPVGAGDGPWTGPDGEALPFRTDEEVLAFLREAEAEKVKTLTSGINRPWKVLLTQDGVRAHAVFRTVDVQKDRFVSRNKVYLDFHDSYIYECAAFEMARLLGLDHVPPCVERQLWSSHGSLQLWIEDAMTEGKRLAEGVRAPSSLAWVRQSQAMRVFDALIRNFDRNQGNMLIDANWKLWFIDHGRSFHKSPEIDKIDRLVWCDRELWEKLRSLERKAVEERTRDYLRPMEITYLLRRRDAIVRHFEERMTELGVDVVLYASSDPLPEGFESQPGYEVASSTEDIPSSSVLEGGD